MDYLDRDTLTLVIGQNAAGEYVHRVEQSSCRIDFSEGDPGGAIHHSFQKNIARPWKIADVFDCAQEEAVLEQRAHGMFRRDLLLIR
jgi:hypothetical protein